MLAVGQELGAAFSQIKGGDRSCHRADWQAPDLNLHQPEPEVPSRRITCSPPKLLAGLFPGKGLACERSSEIFPLGASFSLTKSFIKQVSLLSGTNLTSRTDKLLLFKNLTTLIQSFPMGLGKHKQLSSVRERVPAEPVGQAAASRYRVFSGALQISPCLTLPGHGKPWKGEHEFLCNDPLFRNVEKHMKY